MRRAHRNADGLGPTPDTQGFAVRLWDRGRLDPADRAPAEHARQALDVVGVEMAQKHQRNAVDAEIAQAPVHRVGVRSGIDHDSGAAAGVEDEGVALAHVAHHGEPVVRRPAGQRTGERRRAHQGHGQHDRHGGHHQRTPHHGTQQRQARRGHHQ